MSREINVNGKNMGKKETILVEGGWAIYSASFLLQIFLWDLHDSEINLARNLSSRWLNHLLGRWYHGTVPVAILQWELLAVLAPGHADKWLPYGLSTVRTSYIYGHLNGHWIGGGWFKPDGIFVTCRKFGMILFCLWISRWWQLKDFLFSPGSLGQWSNLTNIFRMGWFNHQPEMNGWMFWRFWMGVPWQQDPWWLTMGSRLHGQEMMRKSS